MISGLVLGGYTCQSSPTESLQCLFLLFCHLEVSHEVQTILGLGCKQVPARIIHQKHAKFCCKKGFISLVLLMCITIQCGMDSNIFQYLVQNSMFCFVVPTVWPSGAVYPGSRKPSHLTSSFRLQGVSHFLDLQNASGHSCTFLLLCQNQICLWGILFSFISKWYLELKVRTLGQNAHCYWVTLLPRALHRRRVDLLHSQSRGSVYAACINVPHVPPK